MNSKIKEMDLKNLYDRLYSTDETKEPRAFIRLYEENQKMIEGTQIQGNPEVYNMVMRITSDYGHSMTTIGHYLKALPILNRAISLLENYSEFNLAEMHSVKMYCAMRMDRAVSNYYLNRFSPAEKDFNWLAEKDPNEINYKRWLAMNGFKRYDKFIKVLFPIIILSGVFCFFVDEKVIGITYYFVLGVFIVSFLIDTILGCLKYINRRKLRAVEPRE